MKTSDHGLSLIKAHEGLRLEAYPDPASGGDPWTIGYGHTRGVKPGDRITQEQADTYLREDVQWAEEAVASWVKVPLSQPQFDALVSLVFNIGAGAFKKSMLLRKLNAGDQRGAADEFMRWVNAAGKVMPGLEKRRAAERALFLSEQAPAPIESRTIPKEQPMSKAADILASPATQFALAAVNPLLAIVPEIAKIFMDKNGTTVPERNVAAAVKLVEVAQRGLEAAGVPAPNAQAVVEAVQTDTATHSAVRQAVLADPYWHLVEAGGGGIEGAREAVKTAPVPSKNPVLWVSAALLPLVYLVVYAVLFREGWSDEVRAMVVAAVVTGALGAVTSYWLGTSISSAKKDDALIGR